MFVNEHYKLELREKKLSFVENCNDHSSWSTRLDLESSRRQSLEVPVCLFPERRGGVTECGHQTTEEERGESELHLPPLPDCGQHVTSCRTSPSRWKATLLKSKPQ